MHSLKFDSIDMLLTAPNSKTIHWLLVLLLCLCGNVLPKNPYKIGEARADYPKGCAYLRCKRGDQCVNRKFWCKNPPCPSMLYCSKSRKESLKGPASCDAVRCSKGFICLVRARHCRWGEACEQQIARCVSEREYYEGAASCADFRCPSGHRCILRESLCASAPCKLLKSCANIKDVNSWFDVCKNMGCLSEHECFLRRPASDCTKSRCKHAPDCLAKNEDEFEAIEQCRGWVCPKGQECSTHTEEPCKRNACRVSRSCHKPLMLPVNMTRPRKHSWKDDIKLSFYSKLEKNSAGRNKSSARTSTNKISRGSANRNTNISTGTAGRTTHERPIYKAPVYVSANARPTSRPSSVSPDITSGREVQPTVTSLSTWLNHLKLKTGVDAIEVWIKKADRQESYGEFREWLESVKDMLGSAAYDLWLEEVRAMTVTSPAFQKWLPPAPTIRPPDTYHYVEPNGHSADFNDEGYYPGPQNSVKYRANEEDSYSPRGNIMGRGYETGSSREDFREDDYIFPPHFDPPTMRPEIPLFNAYPTAAEFAPPSPTIPANEWSQFYPSGPRMLPQANPFQQNFGNVGPWGNQASPYQGFDPAGLFNPWYQQYQSNWSFPQAPMNNREFLRPNPWQEQFIPPPIPQWQQERDPREQFSYDRRMEPMRSPADILRRMMDEPVQYYSPNTTHDDSSWMKYFMDPYQNSQYGLRDSFGSFPMNDGNFDDYPGWPGSSNQGRRSADVPHRRSKHEDSSSLDFGGSRYADRNVDRSAEKLRGSSEDPGIFSSGFPWPIADPRIREYFRYLADYNRRHLYDKKSPMGSTPAPVVNGLSRSHRVNFEPRSPSSNRSFPDSAREFPAPEYPRSNPYPQDQIHRIVGTGSPLSAIPLIRQTVRTRENHRRIDPFPKTNLPEVDEDRARGFAFRNRDFETFGEPMGIPDLWDPRYRTPLSAIVNKIDDERSSQRNIVERVVPVVSPRRRVAPNWIAPEITGNVQLSQDDDFQKEAENADDHSADEEEDTDPMMFSLQGYIESDEESSPESSHSAKNATIFPVYTMNEDTQVPDDCVNYSAGSSEDTEDSRSSSLYSGINFFKNPRYGGNPDFPNYLKSVFDVEAATIMRNMTGEREVEIKGIKWEYDDEEDAKLVENPSSFPGENPNSIPPTDVLSDTDRAPDWSDNASDDRHDGESENYYDDEDIDYEDDVVPEDRSYFDPERINAHDPMNREKVGDDFTDRYFDDPNHKRFKKNRPL